MSTKQMLDMCVRFIAQRHHLLTDEHVGLLNEVWQLYESQEMPPLPPSPPPECRDEAEYERQQEEYERQEYEQQEYERQEYEQQLPPCSHYRGTCDADGCTYECAEACGSSAEPCGYNLENCLYGCTEPFCIAESNQLPPVVQSVVEAAIESDDEMPPLISFAELAAQKGWINPEAEEAEPEEAEEAEEAETEIVETTPEPKAPKVQPTFPYDHYIWPSPRAKMVVRQMLGPRAREILNVKTLTHDNCMRWLAGHYRLSHQELLKTSVYKLHNRERVSWRAFPGAKSYWALPPRCVCKYCKGGRGDTHHEDYYH